MHDAFTLGTNMKKKPSAIKKLRELCKDPDQKRELFKELDAAENAKYQACVVNGRFDYGKMSEMYHKGKW
jgi:hypothetical protein